MRSIRLRLTILALLLPLLGAAGAEAVPSGTTVLVDRPSGFGPLPFDGAGWSETTTHALSADGRYAVFTSSSDALLPGEADDASQNVYRLHIESGRVEQVNTNAAGEPGDPSAVAGRASISADGRYVAFSTFDAGLLPGSPGVGVYVKDMNTGRVEFASRGTGPEGAGAIGGFADGVISGDGRHVAFAVAGPLDAENVDGIADQVDVYVRNLDQSTTRMVSVTFNGAAGGGFDGRASFDIDFTGRAVAYVTDSRIGPGDDDTDGDAYLRTGIGTAGEQTRLVSFSNGQAPGADSARDVALSGDAKSLVAWSANGQIHTAAVSAGVVDKAIRADVARPGGTVGQEADSPAFEPVAAPGAPARLYFRTAGRLDPGDANGRVDIYSVEMRFLGDPLHVHLATSGTAAGSVRDGAGAVDGARVVFASDAPGLPGARSLTTQVYLRTGGTDRNISQPLDREPRSSDAGDARIERRRAVSDDGRLVVFETEAPALGSVDPTNRVAQIVLRDVVSGATELVSATPEGSSGDGTSSGASIDAAGERIAFLSTSKALVNAPGLNGEQHAYVRDRRSGVTTLVDRTTAGAPLGRGTKDVQISPDGRHLVYLSRSPDAPGAPAGGKDHLYAVDLSTGTTELVDRAAGGAPANDHADDGFDVSGDGSRIAFASSATNLGVAGSATRRQLYVRDRVADTTEWASPPETGNDPARVHAVNPSLSRDGNRVAFQQTVPTFGYGMSGSSQIFVRDVAADTTVLGSNVSGTSSFAASLSADGRRLAFTARGDFGQPTLTALADEGTAQSGVYVRDLERGSTTLTSVRLDGNGPRGADQDVRASLAGGGACVAFESQSASDLTEPGYGPDQTHVYLRAVDADCPQASPPPPVEDLRPGGPGVQPARDRVRPQVSRARATPRRFAVGRKKTARTAARGGTKFVFTLSERATTTITIARRESGRRMGRRCVRPRKGLERRCTRIVKQVTLTRKGGRVGGNRVAFSGRVGRTVLKPGSYQATFSARDAAGNRSKAVVARFTVVRARR